MNNSQATPNQPDDNKLFTCILKCAHCLKEIGRQAHMTRTQHISVARSSYKPCNEHPNYGFVTELIPE